MLGKKIKMTESDQIQLRLLREEFTALDSMRTHILQEIAEWTENYDRMAKAVIALEEKYGIYDKR